MILDDGKPASLYVMSDTIGVLLCDRAILWLYIQRVRVWELNKIAVRCRCREWVGPVCALPHPLRPHPLVHKPPVLLRGSLSQTSRRGMARKGGEVVKEGFLTKSPPAEKHLAVSQAGYTTARYP